MLADRLEKALTTSESGLPRETAPRESAHSPADVAQARGLLISVASSQFGISVVYGAVPGVLLALQIADMAGDQNKAGVLSLFTIFGAIAALVAQPLAGRLSDRTRTRVGSRTPWVVGASVIAAPMLWAMGFSQSLLVLAVLYVGSEFVLSAAQGPLSAVLPDRVPIDRRGTYSAGLGMGIMLGSVVGTVLASVLSDNTVVAYLVIGSIPVIMALSRLLVAGDADNRGAPVVLDKVDRGWRSFVVSPSEHPDFWWAIGSRSLTYAGFFTVQGYALYLLQDYIGLGDDAVDLVAVSSGIAALCIVLAAVPSGILSDRVGRRKPFVVAASGTMAAGFIVPLIFPTVAGYLAMIVVMALSFGCFESTDNALVTQVLPRESAYAQDLGVVNVAAVAPQILAPALAGSVVVLTSEYVLIFPLAALFALLGAYSVTRVRGVR